jgi:hypothetical protein
MLLVVASTSVGPGVHAASATTIDPNDPGSGIVFNQIAGAGDTRALTTVFTLTQKADLSVSLFGASGSNSSYGFTLSLGPVETAPPLLTVILSSAFPQGTASGLPANTVFTFVLFLQNNDFLHQASVNLHAKFQAIGPAPATTPIPPALLLFMTAVGGLGLAGWRRKTAALPGSTG